MLLVIEKERLLTYGVDSPGQSRGISPLQGGLTTGVCWVVDQGLVVVLLVEILNSSLISQRRSFRPLPGEGTLSPSPQHTLFQLGILSVHLLKMSLLYNISMAEKNQTIEIWGEGFQFLKSSRWEVGKKSLRTKQDQRAKRQLKTSKNRHISKKNKDSFQFSYQLVFPKNKTASPFFATFLKRLFPTNPLKSSKLRHENLCSGRLAEALG